MAVTVAAFLYIYIDILEFRPSRIYRAIFMFVSFYDVNNILSTVLDHFQQRFVGQSGIYSKLAPLSWQTLLMNHGTLSHWAEMLPQIPFQLSALILCAQNIVLGLADQQHLGLVANAESQTSLQIQWIRFCILAIFPGDSPTQRKSDKCWFRQFPLIKVDPRMKSVCLPYPEAHCKALSLVLSFPSAYPCVAWEHR